MARKQDSTLIHCSSCGEDYSATYKFCPFCGGYNAPPADAPAAPAPEPHKPEAPKQAASQPEAHKHEVPKQNTPRPSAPKQEAYEFDGQDVFDQSDDENSVGKGGKRLASGGVQHPTPPPPVNWPRLITFLCSLVIIAVVLVMLFKVVYPHLRQVSNPNASDAPTQTVSADPNTSASAGEDGLNSMLLDTANITLQADQSHPLTLTFDPVDWKGTVTWSSSDETCATVNAEGVVTNVNTSGTQRRVIITAIAGNQTVTCTVYCQSATASTTPVSTPAPVSTPEPVVTQQPVQNNGDIPNNSKAVIANASGGLRVRSGPGTSYDVKASLNDGDPITVVSYAEDGWYKITYAGSNGSETGYIMGEYISVN